MAKDKTSFVLYVDQRGVFEKLTDEQRQEIKENVTGMSQRKLAAVYGVSRRLIQFVQDPEKHKENLQRRKERGGSKVYYDREKHTNAIRKHRKHKQSLFLEGKISIKNEE